MHHPSVGVAYRPLTDATFVLDSVTSGLSPLGCHVTNVLLYFVNCVLAYWLARAVQGRGLCAVVTGLLFALHPPHAEVACWIKNRAELLGGTFFLLSCLSFHRALARSQERRRLILGEPQYTVALLCFVAALLAKATTIGLAAVLVLWARWSESSSWRRAALAALRWSSWA